MTKQDLNTVRKALKILTIEYENNEDTEMKRFVFLGTRKECKAFDLSCRKKDIYGRMYQLADESYSIETTLLNDKKYKFVVKLSARIHDTV